MTFLQGIAVGTVLGYVFSDQIDEFLGRQTNGEAVPTPPTPTAPTAPPPTPPSNTQP